MQELINDSFYEQIKSYNRCIIDYCLIKSDTPHEGYQSHKSAVLFAIDRISRRYEVCWSADAEKANAKLIDSYGFFLAPDNYEQQRKNNPKEISYRHAFLNTPHKTGYGVSDFDKLNSTLFKNGAESLEIYEWTTDWSDYFDDGHEWWGAACWSVYDKAQDRYVVIMASTTD